MRKRRLGLFVIGIMVFSAILLGGCGAAQDASASSEPTTTWPAAASAAGVLAEGEVIPLQNAKLSFTTSGVVAEILVEEGSAVGRQEVIARLDGIERAQAAVTAAQVELLSAQQALKTLNENHEVALANATQAKVLAEKALDDAIEERTKKDYGRADQDRVDQARAQYYLALNEVKEAEDDFNDYYGRAEDDPDRAAALNRLATARKDRQRKLSALNWYLGKPDALEIAEADAAITVAEAALNDAERTWERLQNGPDPDDLALAEARLRNAEAQLASAKKALADLELRAPFAGTVVTNNLKTGELVSMGGPAAVILADLSAFQIETTDLTELDVVNIDPGDPAVITFDAIPGLELNGKVSRINAFGVNRLGDITYKVTIDLEQQDPRLRWNMTASVSIQP